MYAHQDFIHQLSLSSKKLSPTLHNVSKQRHILIDGYNALHAWPQAKSLRGKQIDRERERLIEAVRLLHDAEHVRLTVVFDGRGTTHDIQRPTNDPSFSVLYTSADRSADDVIEHLVQKSDSETEVIVYSRDNMIAAAVRACGGFMLPPEALWDDLDRASKDQHTILQRHRNQTAKQWRKSQPWNTL